MALLPCGCRESYLSGGSEKTAREIQFKPLSHSENGLDLNKEFSEFKGVFH